ncbi:PREDICTED: receptor-type tyrosine-protein kinase FLT3 [Ficedula albicollis]|uniref:receptor-type tyrosine-protein kinase FLT3 n=1 Tax=Ficedula albicollis TaxID=59894 RepID=UPI0007AD9296|nr:PREDICTED: receptor-type tyrosine-protein kinase FLT3 [Ficedula albicollis]
MRKTALIHFGKEKSLSKCCQLRAQTLPEDTNGKEEMANNLLISSDFQFLLLHCLQKETHHIHPSTGLDFIAYVFYFCLAVFVMTAVAFTSTMTQNTSEIMCGFISHKDEGSGAPETSASPKVSDILEDLGCYLNSQGKENIYQTIKNVEVKLFEDFELRITMSISNIISCFWIFKKSEACKLSFDSENRYITSLTFSQIKETQAGKYTLLVRSETGNYTVVVPVLIQKKPAKPYFRKRENSDSIKCISESYPQASVEWIFCKTPEKSCPFKRHEESGEIDGIQMVQHELFQTYIWCCAVNVLGRECTGLFTIDLNERQAAPLPELLLKVGEPLLIRCRAVHRNYKFGIQLSFENREVEQGHCFKGLEYQANFSAIRIQHVFVPAAARSDSGHYTCSSTAHPNQTALVTVLEKGFINITDSKEDFEIGEEEFCFEVNFTAYPPVRCMWLFSRKAFPCVQSYSMDGRSISSKFCNHQHRSGIYIFYAENDDTVVTKKFTLYVRRKPEIRMQLLFKEISCVAEGYPASSWVWRKCLELNSSNCTEEITEGIQNFLPERRSLGSWISSSTLYVKETATTFSVECCANNSAGSACEKSFINLSVAGAVSFPLDNAALYASIGFFLLLITFVFAFIFLKYKKQFKYESQWRMIQMIGPSDNEYIYIDFREFEYDIKWEFPRENLEFGQVLGCGAFGKVVNATAYGINKAGDSVQVAVKMLKEKPDASEKDALMSELKMMTHIGSHENIVNLLGACTLSGPIYLIFEYCCYGDLLNYLRNKREKFHWTLTDIFKQQNFSFYHNIHQDQNSRMGTHLKYGGSTTLCREDEFETTQRSQNMNVTNGSNGIVLFSEEDQIKIASTQADEEEDFNVLTFEDLLCFSYQVAKGMEFLESKSCIHRDLAARNILVTHGKVVKICDFGLARDVINDSNYIIRGNARLPVKWMAPESLFERTYTMKSDVWSYGILLWEIFSLGVNPYPGIQVDTNFYKLIQSGFKMDQPYYATKDVYCMMQSCWALDSRKRPSFSYLVSSLASQLAELEGAVYHNMKKNVATHHSTIKTKPRVSRHEESLVSPVVLQHEDPQVEK